MELAERVAERHRHPLPGDPGFWEWLARQPADAVPLDTVASVDKLVIAGTVIFGGVSLKETATQTGTIELRDGTDATGPLIYTTAFAAGANFSTNLIPPGILCRRGIFLHGVAGIFVLHGTVYVKHAGALTEL